ncbi:MAG: HAMP domain-containing protein [Deltaproteobacteria bacterium]|nr:HAMP domain-containing protein [Deltaproteobacteria bacterium]
MKRLWPRTIRARLTLWYTAIFSSMFMLLGIAAIILLDRGLRENVDASLLSVARSIAESARNSVRPGSGFDDLIESLLPPGFTDRYFRLLDPFGRPDPRLVPRGRLQLPLSPEALYNAEQGRETYQTLTAPGVTTASLRMLTLPVIERGRIIHLVQVAMPLESAEAVRSHFIFVLLGLTPLALGGAAGGGWFLARRALTPVDTMVEAARKIEAEDLSLRLITTDSHDELDRLAAVLNDMFVRLERSFTAVRYFSADAAHELRTPLTILKGEMEVALQASRSEDEYRQILTSCLEEVDRLSALVQDLLFLARSDSGNVTVTAIPVNLSSVFVEVTQPLRALAETADLTLTAPSPPPLWVNGNTSMLFRLIFNLGENAIKYTPAKGIVELQLTQDGTAALLQIRDNGPGIPAEDQVRIFDRFYRGDPARSRGGTGLGLALVRSMVTLHKGQIAVESEVGRGTCFRVSLPLIPAPETRTL